MYQSYEDVLVAPMFSLSSSVGIDAEIFSHYSQDDMCDDTEDVGRLVPADLALYDAKEEEALPSSFASACGDSSDVPLSDDSDRLSSPAETGDDSDTSVRGIELDANWLNENWHLIDLDMNDETVKLQLGKLSVDSLRRYENRLKESCKLTKEGRKELTRLRTMASNRESSRRHRDKLRVKSHDMAADVEYLRLALQDHLPREKYESIIANMPSAQCKNRPDTTGRAAKRARISSGIFLPSLLVFIFSVSLLYHSSYLDSSVLSEVLSQSGGSGESAARVMKSPAAHFLNLGDYSGGNSLALGGLVRPLGKTLHYSSAPVRSLTETSSLVSLDSRDHVLGAWSSSGREVMIDGRIERSIVYASQPTIFLPSEEPTKGSDRSLSLVLPSESFPQQMWTHYGLPVPAENFDAIELVCLVTDVQRHPTYEAKLII